LKNCKHLKSLNVSGCMELTDHVLDEISTYSQRLEILEIAEMTQLTLNNFYKLSELFLLKKLNISETSLKNESLQRFLTIKPQNLRNLESWQMDGIFYMFFF